MEEIERCSVLFCTGLYATRDEKPHMFEFPKDAKTRAKWIKAIHRTGFQPTDQSRVCEHHFLPSQIQIRVSDDDLTPCTTEEDSKYLVRLVKGAVPSRQVDPAQLTAGYDLYCGHFVSDYDSEQELKKACFAQALYNVL